MEYTVTAKVTYYDGIVFRSRLEAYYWDYIKQVLESLEKHNNQQFKMEYEPDLYRIPEWNPDIYYITGGSEFLVEIKPTSSHFDLISYSKCFDYFPKIKAVMLLCDSGDNLRFNKNGSYELLIRSDRMYKQAYNNVKSSIQ